MKKQIFIISFFISVITTFISACGDDHPKSDAAPVETTKEQYQCPMKCTEEVFDKPGKCPVCEMDLEKVSKS
ncbi:MAG: heavy metal-binding domain-containing protein [Bacteroidota bacterium]